MKAAFGILVLTLRDAWQELWTILVIHLLFLLGNILVVTGPPATLALFFYGNRIVHGESADERDFIQAIRKYWKPAWRWGSINLLVIGLLIGDYYLTGRMAEHSNMARYVQGLYVTLLAVWVLIQWFALPFLFEQNQPSVSQALRNSVVFVGRNLAFVLVLLMFLILSLAVGTLTFMLTFAVGGAVVAFAGNRAVLEHLPRR